MAIFVEIVYLKAYILYFEDIYKFFILLFLYYYFLMQFELVILHI